MNEDLPTNLARGITSQDCLVEGQMKSCVFQFLKNEKEGMYGLSIQWLDNEESEQIAKAMRGKRGDPKYILGFAVMTTHDLEEIKLIECYQNMEYMRVPNDSNPYHGHITIPIEAGSIKRQLASELVLRSTFYTFEDSLPVGR